MYSDANVRAPYVWWSGAISNPNPVYTTFILAQPQGRSETIHRYLTGISPPITLATSEMARKNLQWPL